MSRPAYEAAFGLALVAILLLSTLDETALAPAGRGLALLGFALLTILNAGAATGVYVAAALIFSDNHFAGQGSWVERPDNYALLFLTLYLVLGRSFSRSSGRFGRTGVAIALLVLTTVAHLVSIVGFSAYELTWFMRMFGVPLGMFVLLRRAALTRREVDALFLIIAVVGVYVGFVSLLEELNLYALVVPPWLADPAINLSLSDVRVGGLSMQPEWNALVVSLAFCVLLLRLDPRRRLGRIGWTIGGGLCLLGIYFTYTRAAWLGLFLGGVPLFWRMSAARAVLVRRRVLFITAALGFVALVVLAPSGTLQSRTSNLDTVYFRFNVWAAGARMVVEHPLVGVGFAQFAAHLPAYVRALSTIPETQGLQAGTIAHNTFLSVAAELGMIGLALYLCTLLGVYRSAEAAAGRAWGPRGESWVAGITLVYLVNVQFITAHELMPNLMYFGFMGAVAGLREPWGGPPRAPVGHAGA